MKIKKTIAHLLYPLVKIYWKLFGKPHEGVRAIIVHNDRVLLVRQSYGSEKWRLPGGFVKEGEKPKDALRREMKEELELMVKHLSYRGAKSIGNDDAPTIIHTFVVETDQTDLHPASIEITNARWFPRKNLPKESFRAQELINHVIPTEHE